MHGIKQKRDETHIGFILSQDSTQHGIQSITELNTTLDSTNNGNY